MQFSGTFAVSGLALTATAIALPQNVTTGVSTSWNYLGCYTDRVSARTLPTMKAVVGGSSALTNEACQTACQTAGYSLAGTEYGKECWCGSVLNNDSDLAHDGERKCNKPCKGAKSQICGGSNRLSLWENIAAVPPKRGLAYNDNNKYQNATFANLFKGYGKISWGYNWAYPSYGLDKSFEFVPMLWGIPWTPYGRDAWAWNTFIKHGGAKTALSFNEPDLKHWGSANIKPDVAAAGYQTFLQPHKDSVKIGLPSVLWNNNNQTSKDNSAGENINSRQWASKFLSSCKGCKFDYAAIHYYADCIPPNGDDGAEWFKSNMTDAYKTLGLNLWITEFQCLGTEEEQIDFLQKVLPWLDANAKIARYAYFGVFPEFLINKAGTSLSALGKVYASL